MAVETKNCTVCNSEYTIPKSKAARSKFCSKECKVVAQKTRAIKEYTCKGCNTLFESNSKRTYCCKSCYINSTKRKRIELSCDFCDKKYIKPEGRETKYCSRTCQMLAQSSGLAEIPSNGRQGFRKDLSPNYFFKSSLEADYARWCEFTGRKYIYEHKTFTVQYDGRDKQYTPDFYHPDEDKYVELKAIRRDRKFNSNLLAADLLKQDGIDIDMLLMDEFYRNIKQSGHYWLIDNIENKNYHGTRHLIYLKKKVV